MCGVVDDVTFDNRYLSLSPHFSHLLQLVDCDNTPCKVNQCEMNESE
jgi:hypothetical protein